MVNRYRCRISTAGRAVTGLDLEVRQPEIARGGENQSVAGEFDKPGEGTRLGFS